MKKLLLFTLTLGLFAGCKKTEESPAVTTVNIPDKNFEKALIALKIDSDKTVNGKLLVSDAEKVYTLDLKNIDDYFVSNIIDLTGMEAFKNLSYFRHDGQPIKRLDFKNNPNLTTIIQLNFLGDTYLDYLDVSNCLNLQTIQVNVSGLALDFSKHTKLESIIILGNEKKPFTKLTISPSSVLKKLSFGYFTFDTFDFSQLPNLTFLTAASGNLTSINFSKNTKLEYINIADNKLTKLDVTMLPLLKTLYCENNKLTTVDISKNPLLKDFSK